MNKEYKPFQLTKEEIESTLWQKLKTLYQENLDCVRAQNDHDAPETRTAFMRGRIAAYKEFLSIGENREEN